jgi:hypothetical protein
MPELKWYYLLDGVARGPFNAVQFEKLIRGKTVTAKTEVSQDGVTWRCFADFLAAAEEERSDSSIMNDVTLLPGEVRLPPDWKTQKWDER